jgi:hypothetical protein
MKGEITEYGHKAFDYLRQHEPETLELVNEEVHKAYEPEDLTLRSVFAIERALKQLGLEPNVFFCWHDEDEDSTGDWGDEWDDTDDEGTTIFFGTISDLHRRLAEINNR